MPAGVRTDTRAAASSMASGMPSSRMQISATAGALSSLSANDGSAARARSTNSITASAEVTASADRSSDGGRQRGCTGKTSSPAPSTYPSHHRTVPLRAHRRSGARRCAAWCSCSCYSDARRSPDRRIANWYSQSLRSSSQVVKWSTVPWRASISRARSWERRLKNRLGRSLRAGIQPSWSKPPHSPIANGAPTERQATVRR